MDISTILAKENIFSDVEVATKRQLFEIAAKNIADAKGLDENKIFEALWERENLGSTGYGDGVAVPHARISGLDKVFAIFMRLSNGVDFDAYDDKNVDLLAIIISPEQSGEDHLQALAAFSGVLRSDDACKKLRQAKTSQEIYSILNR